MGNYILLVIFSVSGSRQIHWFFIFIFVLFWFNISIFFNSYNHSLFKNLTLLIRNVNFVILQFGPACIVAYGYVWMGSFSLNTVWILLYISIINKVLPSSQKRKKENSLYFRLSKKKEKKKKKEEEFTFNLDI